MNQSRSPFRPEAFPDIRTLALLFVGLRLPALVLFRPGGYIRPFPPMGTLDVAARVTWRDWLLLGPSPLEPLLLDALSVPFAGEVSRQLAIGLFSLPFEVVTLVLVYRLAQKWTGEEQQARRSALFWAILWLPLWSWLTGLAGIGVALALAAVWLLSKAGGRRRLMLAGGGLSLLALAWTLTALLVLVPAWWVSARRPDARVPWAWIGLLLAVLAALQNRLLDPLLLLLAVTAVARPTLQGAAYAGLLSLLFVLRDPVVPFLLTVESAALRVLDVAYSTAAVGFAAGWAARLSPPPVAVRLRAASLAMAGVVLLAALGSVPLGLMEFRRLARADSPYAPLLDELEQAPVRGYVLLGSHQLYEAVYPFVWRRHTVRVVSERNAEALFIQITSDSEGNRAIWLLGHPQLDEPLVQLQARLLERGFPAGGEWYGDRRLERLTLASPTTAEAAGGTFADAVTLRQVAWKLDAAPGEWVPVELVWEVPEHALQTAIYVHLRDAEGRTVAQHDAQPTWTAGQLVTRHALRLPPDRQGTFSLVVGRYVPQTGERVLTVSGADGIMVGNVAVR